MLLPPFSSTNRHCPQPCAALSGHRSTTHDPSSPQSILPMTHGVSPRTRTASCARSRVGRGG
eukprot:2803474-Rhodomonas_salina.1